MTAEDVKFTVDLFLEQGITEFRSVVDAYFESIEVLDTHKIRFAFTEDAPKRERVGLVGLWNPFSKAWFEETGARLDESTDEPFLGTGPYILGEFDIGRSLRYVQKNPNWWGADHPLNTGRHNFEAVRIEYFADAISAFEGFKAGEYTMRIENSSKTWATSYDFPALESGWVKKETLPDGNITPAQGFIFNLRREKWQDPRTRDAVRMLFNFEWSNETLFYGLYQRPASFWGGSDLAADGTPEGEELALLEPLVAEGLLSEALLTEPAIVPPENEADQNRPSRRVLRQASRLLEEAGWITGDDGMRRNEAGRDARPHHHPVQPALRPDREPLCREPPLGGHQRQARAGRQRAIRGAPPLGRLGPHQPLARPGFRTRHRAQQQWFGSSETAADSSRNLMALQNPAIDKTDRRW